VLPNNIVLLVTIEKFETNPMCCNPNIVFVTKCEVQGPMSQESVFRCETHSHKWGRVQGMEPDDSQVHSHFGSYISVGVVNVQKLGWKGKQAPNWDLRTLLERSQSINA
jgi:hypothetical protein